MYQASRLSMSGWNYFWAWISKAAYQRKPCTLIMNANNEQSHQDQFEKIDISCSLTFTDLKQYISVPQRSTTWIRKTIRFIMAVSAEHLTYNNTLYNNLYYIQTCGGKTRTELSVSLHNTVRIEARKNLPEKTPIGKTKNSTGNLGRIHGSRTEKPILRRLHGWKIFALVYQTCIPTKHGKL